MNKKLLFLSFVLGVITVGAIVYGIATPNLMARVISLPLSVITLIVLGFGIGAIKRIQRCPDLNDEPTITTNNTLIGMHPDLIEDVKRMNEQDIRDFKASLKKEKR